MTNRKAAFGVGLLIALGLAAGASTPTQAQPDPNEQPKAFNPIPQMPFGNGQAWQNMTPEERRAALRQFVEQIVRGSLARLGYNDQELQNAVVTTALERETALDAVREKHRAVTQGLMNQNVTDEQMLVLMGELENSIEEAKTKRAASLAALDDKIAYSQQPRLAALLSLIGVTSDNSALLGGILGSVMGTMANVAGAQTPAQAAAAPENQPPAPPDARPE